MPKVSAIPPNTLPTMADSIVTYDASGNIDALVTITNLCALLGLNIMQVLDNPCYFSVYRAASFVDGGATPTRIPYDTAIIDKGSDVNLTTGQFTVPFDGVFKFNSGTWRDNKVGGSTYLHVNGALAFVGTFTDSGGNNSISMISTPPMPLEAGDVVEIRSGGEGTPRNLSTGPNVCYWGGEFICAT